MARPSSTHPTDVELKILRILWANGPMALSAICKQMRIERNVATTTVATMLRVMLDKRMAQRCRPRGDLGGSGYASQGREWHGSQIGRRRFRGLGRSARYPSGGRWPTHRQATRRASQTNPSFAN